MRLRLIGRSQKLSIRWSKMEANRKMPPLPPSKPAMEQSDPDAIDGLKTIAGAPKKGIEVRALRKGFIHQDRKEEGDVFIVEPSQLSEWMECTDPVHQKKHEAEMTVRKIELRKVAKENGIQRIYED